MSGAEDNVTFSSSVTRTGVSGSGSSDVAATGSGTSARRFAPGAIVGGRYRLVALLGKGGMGEVYRAEDLTLDQPVALKFLPPGVAADDVRLGQFHNELRLARQVSHKNVCRLYDLGDADGHRFLTMEYVDGEDLSVLLRRIGRLPQDKAVQIARQLCAGLAAAHERGVLHRDLKPANVMIDGNGDVRITDFGIARTAASEALTDFSGTPQYMAPELFSGGVASIQSDIYALGLTLFELFTGRRVHESKTLDELRRQHQTGTVPTATAIVRDLDPAVDRAIVRCLERDPAKRPGSALTVSAMLPGADALADALAAGETPSPELLAAAAETDALPVWRGLGAMLAVAIGAAVFAQLSGRVSIFGRTPHELPPIILADRAKAVVHAAGYDDLPVDEAYELDTADGYVRWLREKYRGDMTSLASGRPSGLTFWYRSSPRDLVTLTGDTPTLTDPPVNVTGMRIVELDAQGRLLSFRSVPPQREATQGSPPALNWAPLFAAADLDISTFTSVEPEWTPRDFADTRAAWEGPLPGLTEERLRVEAASYRGRPVSFLLVTPWTRPTLMIQAPRDPVDRIFLIIAVTFFLVVLAASVALARRNLRQQRADRRGAARVATALAAILAVSWLLAAVHAGITVLEAHVLAAEAISLLAGMTWLSYLALEPYARRFWPHMLLGWSRLLAGYIRDPRVGSDLLVGVLCGMVLAYADVLRGQVMVALGFRDPMPVVGSSLDVLLGAGPFVSRWLVWLASGLMGALITVLAFVLLRLLLKRTWLVVAVGSLLLFPTAANYMGTSSQWMWLIPLAQGIVLALVIVRYGLLTLAVTRLVWYMLDRVPMTADFSHWSASASNWSMVLLLVLVCFGFYASRSGQPLFGAVLKD